MKLMDCLLISLMATGFLVISVIAVAVWDRKPTRTVCIEPLNCFSIPIGTK